MTKKKYLSLEEAANVLGVDTKELNQLRENGDIRAFADRGSWKFRPEDVENLQRSREFDSSPDRTLAESSEDSDFDAIIADGDSGADIVLGDSGADMVLEDPSESDEQSTIVRRREGDDSSSDSDVKLVFDDALTADGGSSEEIALSPLTESDSDVRLTADSSVDSGSDSDVKLVGGSSVEIEKSGSGSDSDVSLVGSSSDEAAGSDSDVQLIQTDDNELNNLVNPPENTESEYAIDMGTSTGDSEGSSVLGDDSGIALEDDSGISLEADSGLSLASDSGISLADDSGLSLAGDSGISLASDSGISLASDDDGGFPLAGSKDKTEAFSTIDEPSDDGINDTNLEVPAIIDDESDFEFSTNLLDTDSETSVITLDDEESGEPAIFEESSEVLDFEADGLADDMLTEGEELDLIGASEDDFDEGLMSGESHSGFSMPAGRAGRVVEQEWGTGVHVGLWIGTAVMAIGLLMMFDVVRNMWGDAQPDATVGIGSLIDTLSGIF